MALAAAPATVGAEASQGDAGAPLLSPPAKALRAQQVFRTRPTPHVIAVLAALAAAALALGRAAMARCVWGADDRGAAAPPRSLVSADPPGPT
jgi:hypothetical protein